MIDNTNARKPNISNICKKIQLSIPKVSSAGEGVYANFDTIINTENAKIMTRINTMVDLWSLNMCDFPLDLPIFSPDQDLIVHKEHPIFGFLRFSKLYNKLNTIFQ